MDTVTHDAAGPEWLDLPITGYTVRASLGEEVPFMNDKLTPKQLRQLLQRQKKALAGQATSWRPKAHYSHSPEETKAFRQQMLEDYKAKLKRQAESGNQTDEE